jgi:hypothetical protein
MFIFLSLFSFLICSPFAQKHKHRLSTKTLYKDSSQGSNLWTQYHKEYKNDISFNMQCNTTYRFEQTINNKNIAEILFNNNELLLKGNDFQNNDLEKTLREPHALVAEYFGFGSDTNTSIVLHPKITNHIVDLQLNASHKNGWLICNIPFTYSMRSIFNQKKIQKGTIGKMPLQNSATAIFYTPRQDSKNDPIGWKDIRIISKKNYKLGNAVDSTDSAFNNNYDGVLADDGGFNIPTNKFSDIAFYIFDDSSKFVFDNATNIETPCANIDSDFNIDIQNGDQTQYPLLNEEIGIGLFQSSYLNTLKGHYNTLPNDTTNPGYFIIDSINGNELGNTWINVCDNYSAGLEIIVPPVNSASNIEEGLGGYQCGDFNGRTYNNFYFNDNSTLQSTYGIADIQLSIGWNIHNDLSKRIGIYVKNVLPTGTKIDPLYWQYTFSPIIGNGNHFELGGGINGFFNCYESDQNIFRIAYDGYVTHAFQTQQFRICDDMNKPMSRYALLKELTYNPNVTDTFTADIYAYNKVLKSLGDVNNKYIDVAIDLQGEAIVDLIYCHKNWEAGLGYNFMGQTKETMKECNENIFFDQSKFYGYHLLSGTTSIAFVPANDTTTEVNIATFAPSGSIAPEVGTYIQAKTNGMVAENKNADAYTYGISRQATADDVFQYKKLNDSCLMPEHILHTIFLHIDYHYKESDWNPFVSMLGSIGFVHHDNFSLAKWNIGGRLGFIF